MLKYNNNYIKGLFSPKRTMNSKHSILPRVFRTVEAIEQLINNKHQTDVRLSSWPFPAIKKVEMCYTVAPVLMT